MTRLEALRAIAARNGGMIMPSQVVDEARDPASVLHGSFEWDDTVAAEKYRVIQAQKLIRAFVVTIECGGEKIDVPAFVGVSADRNEKSANNPYHRIENVKEYPDILAVAEKDALNQLVAIRKRHGHLKRLSDVWGAIDGHTEK